MLKRTADFHTAVRASYGFSGVEFLGGFTSVAKVCAVLNLHLDFVNLTDHWFSQFCNFSCSVSFQASIFSMAKRPPVMKATARLVPSFWRSSIPVTVTPAARIAAAEAIPPAIKPLPNLLRKLWTFGERVIKLRVNFES